MKLPLGQLLKEPEGKTLVAFANPAGGNPVKPQSRLQKYRLTSQGKRMLESPEN